MRSRNSDYPSGGVPSSTSVLRGTEYLPEMSAKWHHLRRDCRGGLALFFVSEMTSGVGPPREVIPETMQTIAPVCRAAAASTRAPDQLPAVGKTRSGALRSRGGRPRGDQERFNLALEPAADGRARQPLEIVRIADR